MKAQPWRVCRRRGREKSGLWLLGGREGAALGWWDGVLSPGWKGTSAVCVPGFQNCPGCRLSAGDRGHCELCCPPILGWKETSQGPWQHLLPVQALPPGSVWVCSACPECFHAEWNGESQLQPLVPRNRDQSPAGSQPVDSCCPGRIYWSRTRCGTTLATALPCSGWSCAGLPSPGAHSQHRVGLLQPQESVEELGLQEER